MRCNSCEILYVNGIRCHETGCPDAWEDEIRTCKWCGNTFKPTQPTQEFCDNSCWCCYVGEPDPEDERFEIENHNGREG